MFSGNVLNLFFNLFINQLTGSYLLIHIMHHLHMRGSQYCQSHKNIAHQRMAVEEHYSGNPYQEDATYSQQTVQGYLFQDRNKRYQVILAQVLKNIAHGQNRMPEDKIKTEPHDQW